MADGDDIPTKDVGAAAAPTVVLPSRLPAAKEIALPRDEVASAVGGGGDSGNAIRPFAKPRTYLGDDVQGQPEELERRRERRGDRAGRDGA